MSLDEPKIMSFQCSAIGVSGTTQVFVRPAMGKDGLYYIARVGVAILGMTNVKPELLKDMNPFDTNFHDNFAEGIGRTQGEAIDALKDDTESIADSLWA